MNNFWKKWIVNINKIIELETKIDLLKRDIKESDNKELKIKNMIEIKISKNKLRKEKRKAIFNKYKADKNSTSLIK